MNVPGQIPLPSSVTQPRQPAPLNYFKHFNNWNVCFSCGWDVPAWHTSKTCQWRKQGHREEVDRTNAQAYKDAGHDVCMKASHKKHLPVNPTQWQA